MPSIREHSVTLLAFGRRGYGLAACNAVRSLRHHGYKDRIDVYVTRDLDGHIPTQTNTVIHHIQDCDPGFAKLLVPEMITGPTLYLDVDTLALQDVTPLIKALKADGRGYITSVQGTGDATSHRIKYFGWALPAKVASMEGFAYDAPLYGIQSSWMWMAPGATLTRITERAQASYRKWTRQDLKHSWGGSKPDELFWGIGCTATGHDPTWTDDEPMWFGSGIFNHAQIRAKHVLMTLPGQKQTTPERARVIYDAEAKRFGGHKYDYIFGDKHVNYKTQHHGMHLMRQPQGAQA